MSRSISFSNIHFVFFSVLLTLPLSAFSQIEKLGDPVPNFSALIVSDMERSLQWYNKTLGFEIQNRMNLEERGIKQANLKRGDAHIELLELRNSIPPDDILDQGKRLNGFFKIGFSLPDFDDWIGFLREANVDFHGDVVNDPNSGNKMVIIKDPDGNRIQLFEK